VKKAELTRNRLLFIVSALRTLLADEHFVTLLRAEGLDSMPRYLADRVQAVAPPAS
jgi:ParB family chromosome partitioning protein